MKKNNFNDDSQLEIEEELEMEEKGFFYSYNMIFDLDISEHAKILYLYLCRRADSKNTSFPSYENMGKACGFSRRTAIRALKELMYQGLLIKKRQGNGLEQTVNKYMLFREPKEDLMAKNCVQLKRELEEYKERQEQALQKSVEEGTGVVQEGGSDSETLGGDSQTLGSDSETLVLNGDSETLGGDTQTLGGVSLSLEVQPIEGIPIKGSSSSLFAQNYDAPPEVIALIQHEYEIILKSTSPNIIINGEVITGEKVKRTYLSLEKSHIQQVADYIQTNHVKSMQAIRTALFNAPLYTCLAKNTNKKINADSNKFHNFQQREYDYDTLEKELLRNKNV